MHAPSNRGPQIVQRAAAPLLALFLLVLAGCGGGGGDNPALSSPQQNSSGGGTSTSTAAPIPPQLQADLDTISAGLHRPCQQTTTRHDAKLLSVRWVCAGNRVSTATLSVADGRRLSLSDLFMGSYISYLQSTASAQLQADGSTNPVVSDLSAWVLTPDSLEITFPAGTVSFPLSSLSPYLRRGLL